ncbi:MAG: hypothetical protein FWE60_01615 [Oscillospiraceae bacterium]|nr:hypothetical protein [Oscillospiraceae bacterium]
MKRKLSLVLALVFTLALTQLIAGAQTAELEGEWADFIAFTYEIFQNLRDNPELAPEYIIGSDQRKYRIASSSTEYIIGPNQRKYRIVSSSTEYKIEKLILEKELAAAALNLDPCGWRNYDGFKCCIERVLTEEEREELISVARENLLVMLSENDAILNSILN